MKKIKLIATDLDGTFLTDDKRISPKNKEAVHEAVEKGIHFVPATGRAYYTMPPNVMRMGEFDYIITSNGAAVIDVKSGKTVYKKQLERSIASKIIDYAIKRDIMVEIFVDGKAYTMRKYMESLVERGVRERFVKWYTDTRNVVESYDEILVDNITVENINIIFNNKELRVEMQKEFAAFDDIEVTNSIDNNIEIGAKGCSKASALKALADMLGIEMDEIMALGDNYNDLDMIKEVGIGVAVSNGEEIIRTEADYITTSNNEDGFYEAVHKFILN